MPSFTDILEFAGNRILAPFGYEVRNKILDEKPEGFPGYFEQARRAGKDVNEWEEEALGWFPAAEILELTTNRYLTEDSVVCELGPGTGRFSRLMLPRIPRGKLILVDHSPWMVRFLQSYFRSDPRVEVQLGDGQSLPMRSENNVDVIFAAGTLVCLKLGTIYLYARDFARVLKPGGVAILDYIDPTTHLGWSHMMSEAQTLGYVYTYHAGHVLDRVFDTLGFDLVGRIPVEKSTYLIVRKRG